MAAVATKDQERQAVEKIRKIVEGLGTNSYVGTAMQGVLEVAEQNIEYDAAFSLKEEKDIAERREQEQRENAERLNKELEAAKSELAQCKEWWKDQQKILKDELQKALAQADRYRMPKDMYESLWLVVDEAKERAQRGMMDSAVLMSGYIGDTDETEISPKVREAAKRFRKHRKRIQECKELLEMLQSRYEEGAEKE